MRLGNSCCSYQAREMATCTLLKFVALTLLIAVAPLTTTATLSPNYYDSSCPDLEWTVRNRLLTALRKDERVGGSILRLHFHDCIVQGCDGSVLLDDTSTFTGEQTAPQNDRSLRGFDVVDDIKSSVEDRCAATVSCADLLALVAREAVVAAGGPSWTVEYGRRDSRTASLSAATSGLPFSTDTLTDLTNKFSAVGLDQVDMVAISGAHTFGKAQCVTFQGRLFNISGTGKPDPTIDSAYLSILQAKCPEDGSNTTLVDLDQGTPTTFDNSYYSNLLSNKGILMSNQELESDGGSTANTVNSYASSQNQFFAQFADSMIKMGRINPLTGSQGEVRTTCGFVN